MTDPASGMNIMYSLWRPTPEELASLNAGFCIVLGIFGSTHPVIHIGVNDT